MRTQLAPPDWRRHLRLSVTGLIVLVLVTGGSLGWFVRSARIQRAVVRTLFYADATVVYDWQWKDGEQVIARAPWWRVWLTRTFGDDYLGTVIAVEFAPDDIIPDDEMVASSNGGLASTHERWPARASGIDNAVARVAALTQLRSLELAQTPVTDAGLVHLKELSHLETLDLESDEISDLGVEQLKRLRNLKDLNIAETRITDAALAHLVRLRHLEKLDLSLDRITDNGLERLKGLVNLKELNLCHTLVTDRGLVHLRDLSKLEELCLGNCGGISDAGLVNLKELKRLRVLILDGSQVTDAGLLHLEGLANLTYLGLMETQVTGSGIRRLEQALPETEIQASLEPAVRVELPRLRPDTRKAQRGLVRRRTQNDADENERPDPDRPAHVRTKSCSSFFVSFAFHLRSILRESADQSFIAFHCPVSGLICVPFCEHLRTKHILSCIVPLVV
jgi:hypothetical protein